MRASLSFQGASRGFTVYSAPGLELVKYPMAQKVLALINPKSGVRRSYSTVLDALQTHWDVDGRELHFQFSRSAEDGRDKVHRAIDQGVDTILVAGGDGMINSIGAAMMGSDIALGVIPTGSGNGFARHFDIPLQVNRAAEALSTADIKRIDVGHANGHPFFVTCSLAWDAALVKTFEKSPVRGVLPYVFSAAYGFLDYRPQDFEVQFPDGECVAAERPMVFTAANLTQFGGGAKIAPQARSDDGQLVLVTIAKKDSARCIANLPMLFRGKIDELEVVHTRTFTEILVRREHAAPIQVDGELLESGPDVEIKVEPKALNVLVPKAVF